MNKLALGYFLLGILIGLLFGGLLIYKVEINTINEAFDALDYCYQTYALGNN